MEAWCDLTLSYYRHIKAFTVDVNEAQSSPLFNNTKANRKELMVELEFILRIF